MRAQQLGDRVDASPRGCGRRTPARRGAPRAGSPRGSATSSKRQTCVRTASRSGGGVWITDRSRSPLNAIWSVRGIGVAVSVSTSTSALQLLDALLVRHAEAVLLVDHDEAEVAERDVLLEQAVGADHDVDRARREPLEHGFALASASGSARATRSRPDGPRSACAKVSKCCWRAPSSAPARPPACRPSPRGTPRASRPRSCRSRRRRTRAGPSAAARRGRRARRRSRRPGRASPRTGTRASNSCERRVARREGEARRDLARGVHREQLARHATRPPSRTPLFAFAQVCAAELVERGTPPSAPT